MMRTSLSFFRSFAFVAACLLALTGLVSAQTNTLTLEGYFTGKTFAYGKFRTITGTERRFKVDLTGTWDGRTLRLREDFFYDDGEKDTKTWIFRKTGPTTYKGTREDVLGETTVKLYGDTARFTYRVNLAGEDGQTIVRFFDTLKLRDDGALINTARVTKFLFPVARVQVNFARTESQAEAIRP